MLHCLVCLQWVCFIARHLQGPKLKHRAMAYQHPVQTHTWSVCHDLACRQQSCHAAVRTCADVRNTLSDYS